MTTSRTAIAAVVAAAAMLAATAGCGEWRDPSLRAGYVDDATITASIKSRLVEDKVIDADAIKVETVNGNVMLTGSARNTIERSTAESIAMKIRGVKTVQNNVAIQP
jgi:hyperosmotically inducible periplasmic protein